MHGTVSTLYVLSLLYLSVKNYIITYKFEWRACIRWYDDLRKASEVFTLVQLSEIIFIVYHVSYVYYDYYKIDRNKQSKITVHETDILNSHFTEHFYRQSRLTAVEQITFHNTKIKHFTWTNIDHSQLTKIPFPTLYRVSQFRVKTNSSRKTWKFVQENMGI
jgi:hypothetical protein